MNPGEISAEKRALVSKGFIRGLYTNTQYRRPN